MTPADTQPLATLDALHAKVDHLIVTTELTAARTQGFDDRIARVETTSRDLRRTAQMLSSLTLRVQFMRVGPIILAALLAGIFGGTAAIALRPPTVVPPVTSR